MKYVKQFFIIICFSFLGELLNRIIPLKIPASIYGLVLLFLALLFGIIKLPQVKETAHFLITIMPIMFIPPGVGLLDSWGILQKIWIPVFVISVISTILVMGISGKVTEIIIHMGEKQKKEDKDNE